MIYVLAQRNEMKKKILLTSEKILNIILFCFLLTLNTCMVSEGFLGGLPTITFCLLFVFFLLKNGGVRYKYNISVHLCWYLLFIIYMLSSLYWALQPRTYVFANFKRFIIIIVMILILTNVVDSVDRIDAFIKCLIWSMFVSIIILVWNMGGILTISGRLGEAIGLNANVFGMRCAFSAFFSFFLFSIKREKKYLLLVCLFSFFAFLSGSRKALVILVMGICAYEMLSAKGIKLIKNIVIAIGIGLIIFWLIFNVPLLYDIIGHRMENLLMGLRETSLDERAYFRNTAIRLFKERPIFGWGFDSFKTYMSIIGYWNIAYSHCNFTEILATLGIVGMVLYYWEYVNIGINLLRKPNQYKNMALVLLVTIVVCEYGLVDYSDEYIQFLLVICYLCGRERINGIRIGKGNEIVE